MGVWIIGFSMGVHFNYQNRVLGTYKMGPRETRQWIKRMRNLKTIALNPLVKKTFKQGLTGAAHLALGANPNFRNYTNDDKRVFTHGFCAGGYVEACALIRHMAEDGDGKITI